MSFDLSSITNLINQLLPLIIVFAILPLLFRMISSFAS